MFKQLISWLKSLYKKENINSHSNTSYQLEAESELEQEPETTNRVERVSLSPELLAEKTRLEIGWNYGLRGRIKLTVVF